MSFSVDQPLLQQILSKAHPDSTISVDGHKIGQYDVEPGTNNTSEIFGVSVEYSRDGQPAQARFVFKVPFLSANFGALRKTGLYDQETYVYSAVLPAMGKLLPLPFVPVHYHTTASNVLVLEDLSAQGYYMVRRSAMNYGQSRLVLRELAKFHAASVKLDATHPMLLAPVANETLYTDDLIKDTLAVTFPVILDVLRVELGPGSRVLEKLTAYAKKIAASDDICRLSGRSNGFDVLNHGKLKTNNVLLKNDAAGRPTAVKLIDYQTCRWNSPVLDLVYLCMISVDYAVFEQRYVQLLADYLATLNGTLAKLGCERAYTEDDHDEDLRGSKLYQIFTLFWVGFLDVRGAVPGFDHSNAISWDAQKIETVRQNEDFRNNFLRWLGYYEKKGYFT